MYELIYAPEAQANLDEMLDEALRVGDDFAIRFAESLEHRLDDLGRSPTSGTTPSEPPYAPGMLLRFVWDDPDTGRRCLFTALFRYAADEMQLWVLSVGCDWLFTE